MLDLDGIEILPPIRPLVITLEVWPEEVELALASNGNSLRRGLMLALIATMAVETGDIAGAPTPPLPWVTDL
jgi:hypothetical protein